MRCSSWDGIFSAAWQDPEIPVLMCALVLLVWLYEFAYESRFRDFLRTGFVRVVWRWPWWCIFAFVPRAAALSSISNSKWKLCKIRRQRRVSATAGSAIPFGVNEMRLNARQWLAALAILGLVALLTSPVWKRLERFDTGPDYRLPYALSKDYWLYQRRMEQAALPDKVILLGDSVVWGEYVLPEGTLSHFLNQEAGVADRFINGGLNGVFPLAQEGLVTTTARPCASKN